MHWSHKSEMLLLLSLHQPGHVGLIKLRMSPKEMIEQKKEMVDDLAMDRYGQSPAIKIGGHTLVTFPYVEMPLDYILPELLKNAMRATVEHHQDLKAENMPPIKVTISSNPIDFIIRCVMSTEKHEGSVLF